MTTNEFRILLIDDDEDDFVHIRDLLSEITSSKFELSWEATYEKGLKALLSSNFDACLLDYRLGEKTGLEMLVEGHSKGFSCPIIFLTGLTDFEIDIRAMQMGASDYLVKGQFNGPLLERSIRYSIKHRHDLEELKESKSQIIHQDRLASLGLLASSLAHEIGTPLGIIRSRAEMVEKKFADNEVLKRDMGVIISQIDRITKLVNSLLNVARERKADIGSAVLLNSVLEDVLGLLQPEFNRKGIEFSLITQSNFKVKAESGPLGQVLINLLVNAVHAIEESRRKGSQGPQKISVSIKELGNQIELLVRDSGIGIPKENLQHIFKPFFTTKDIGQGTGLGLATSLGIVHSWGGQILVSSELGFGTEFCILLPKA